MSILRPPKVAGLCIYLCGLAHSFVRGNPILTTTDVSRGTWIINAVIKVVMMHVSTV